MGLIRPPGASPPLPGCRWFGLQASGAGEDAEGDDAGHEGELQGSDDADFSTYRRHPGCLIRQPGRAVRHLRLGGRAVGARGGVLVVDRERPVEPVVGRADGQRAIGRAELVAVVVGVRRRGPVGQAGQDAAGRYSSSKASSSSWRLAPMLPSRSPATSVGAGSLFRSTDGSFRCLGSSMK